MSLQQITAELEQMLKAAPAAEDILKKSDADDEKDDEEISEMADGDADDDGEKDSEDATDDVDDEDDDETFGKSFAVTLDDGSEAEAINAESLLKSINKRFNGMTNALESSTALIKSLTNQNAVLHQRVEMLAKSGKGRKSTLNVHEKNATGQPAETKANPRAMLAKALDAQRAGRITSAEVSELDVYLGRGLAVPETLLAKIG